MSPLGIIILSFNVRSVLKHVFSFTEDNDGSLSLEEFQKAFELLATSPTSSHKLRSVCLKSLVSRDESNLSSLWIG